MDTGKPVGKGDQTRSGIFKKLKLCGKKSVEIIDMEQQFELFNKVFNNLKHDQIYGEGRHGLNDEFKDSREIRVSCTDETQQVSFNLVETMDEFLFCTKIEYVHLGGIMIAVKGMQRTSPGAKTFVALYDRRFVRAEQGVIGTHEIDMSATNGAIIYFCPKFPMDPKEFLNNIKVGIKTKGIELQRGVENLMIRTGFIGNICAESPSPECKMTQEKMGKLLAGKGIKAVPGREYTALEWNLETFFEKQADASFNKNIVN